jgi:hypothetical protein
MDYLKIGRADELKGRDYKIYRYLEILPGFLSWFTLIFLVIFSYLEPVYMAFFIIAFDVYWLLLVIYLGIHLAVSYRRMKANLKKDWQAACQALGQVELQARSGERKVVWEDLLHLVIFPVYNESYDIIRPSFAALAEGSYPTDKMILVLTIEERGGEEVRENAEKIKAEFGSRFRDFILCIHPDGLPGEMKGKGANQAYAASIVKEKFAQDKSIDEELVVVSVFDIDTLIYPDYFFILTHTFLTVSDPYHASYQPVPVYHNNVWQAPFFARVAASSNTFWQMMQQIRQEKLATYSSHSMTWQALRDVNFWSKTMVSEDSRIFWHCFCFYKGNYRVEPLNYPVSMDVTMDKNFWLTARSLYFQQRRWGWGVENLPYLIFNTWKMWTEIPRRKFLSRIGTQLYGFHSWATNAIIIGGIGWLPLLLGGDSFNSSVLSTNLPTVTRTLMLLAMSGLVFSAILSTILLPKRPPKYGFIKTLLMLVQWLILPVSIIVFGSIPGIEAQTRLMFKKYLGFMVTPKSR